MRRALIAVFVLSLVLSLTACAWKKAPQAAVAEKETVVLLHGLARSSLAMWRLADRLEAADYHVVRVGYRSLTRTPDEIVADISQQINACCEAATRKVHFVGHSLGGLLIRAYLAAHRPDNLGHVVMIGTPNHGSEVVDVYREHPLFDWAGPMTAALGTGENSFAESLPLPDYPLGVIAGYLEEGRENPAIPGPDDGLVSVASTRLQGMQDFIALPSGHSALRYSPLVAQQTVNFLHRGQFVFATE